METYTDLEQKQIIADNLQELISRSGKEQKNIALELEVNPPTFNQWVTGKATPQVSTLRKVANYFNVPFSYLINKHDGTNEDNDVKAFPSDLAFKYSKLGDDSKEKVKQCIENEYAEYSKREKNYRRVISLDKIESIEDAKILLPELVAFGYATEEQLLQAANEILKFQKEKYKK